MKKGGDCVGGSSDGDDELLEIYIGDLFYVLLTKLSRRPLLFDHL